MVDFDTKSRNGKRTLFLRPETEFYFFDYQKKNLFIFSIIKKSLFQGAKKRPFSILTKKYIMEKRPFFCALKQSFIFFKIPN